MSKRKRIEKKGSETSYQLLEPKNLLAGISFEGGVVTIEGTQNNDMSLVTLSGNQIDVTLTNHPSESFQLPDVDQIVFRGLAGDDTFKNFSHIASYAFGHHGNDLLIGGSGQDRMRGGPGQDNLQGKQGNDYLGGDLDDDRLVGGQGNDKLVGAVGNDRIFGEAGHDVIYSGDGNDYARGGSGHDRIYGYRGNDRLFGDAGNDQLNGQDGDDILMGDIGNDQIFGEAGKDVLDGGDDDDRLIGGDDSDRLSGRSGDDLINGNDGDDWISGGDDLDRIFGENGNDEIFAGAGNDVVLGGQGLDLLFGQDGDDSLNGESQNDDLNGGRGADRLVGGTGNDDFQSDSSDSIFNDADDFSPDGDFEIEGQVSNYNEQSQTFTVHGIEVNFSSAIFRDPISNGTLAKVEGNYFNNILNAIEIEAENELDVDNFEARGIVTNLNSEKGTFEFHGFVVDFNNAQIDGRLANGENVKVEGAFANGNITAFEIDNKNEDGSDNDTDGSFELRGAVQNYDANNMTFTLLGIEVDFSNSFVEGPFDNQSFVKVDGVFDGQSLTAFSIELENDNGGDENFRARGQVSALDTGSQTFEFLGFVVDYSSADIDDPFDEGDSVEIRGWFDSISIAADRIKQ